MADSCPQGDANCPDGEPPFDFGMRLGLVFIIEAATLSLFSVLGLLLYIAVSLDQSNAKNDTLNTVLRKVHHDQVECEAEVVCCHTRALVLLEPFGLGAHPSNWCVTRA